MKKFKDWYKDVTGIEPNYETAKDKLLWCEEERVPMIVSCTCCGMTMSAPSALIDHTGQVFCTGCSELTEDEPLPEDAEDLGDWDVDESAYDPYLGCDVWETEPFDDMW